MGNKKSDNFDEEYIKEISSRDIEEQTTKRTKKQKMVEVFETDKVVMKPLEVVMHESMLPYSEFVILDRALPRVEDGLKPVQRRVLYSMLEVGVLPDKPFRKSATIVGDCMSKYHPHGDRSIYDTLARMAQPFNMGDVLISGHGNFGSIDGDSPAAMRYTEAKLAPIALELLRDIEKDTVDWAFNYDDSCKEPVTLPGRFPNLLVNGGTGIAVGLATNIPTHNLKEVCNAVIAYINNRNITIDELLEIMPGPDFSTGGFILKNSEIKQMYETGKGKIFIRSKIKIENGENGKKSIVINEIPFQVNKSTMLQRIAKLKENDTTGLLGYITDIVDESDRSGIRAVIKLKKDAKVNKIINYLLKNSELQTSFNANIVAIADGKPKQLSLKEILEYYVNYQQKVVYNRTKYDLEQCLKKEHILAGLLIAINNIDEVVKIIKTSKSVTDAKIQLINRFELSEVQSQAILDMRLARLTSLEVNKLTTELERLRDLIKRYTSILKSPAMQMKIVKQELSEVSKQYGSIRRSNIIEDVEVEIDDDVDDTEEDSIDTVNVIISPLNSVKKVNEKSYALASKELSANPSVYEIPTLSNKMLESRNIYLFTNLGNCIKIAITDLEYCKLKDKGLNINAIVKNFGNNEKVIAMLNLEENKNSKLIFVTKQGLVKISEVKEYFSSKTIISAISLKDNDELVNVEFDHSNKQLSIFTKNGMALTFDKSDISILGRVAVGVRGILLEDDYVISAMQCTKSDAFVVIFADGNAKIIKYDEIPLGVRYRKGIKVVSPKNKGGVIKADLLNNNTNYVLEDINGALSFLVSKNIKIDVRLGTGKNYSNKETIINAYKYVINK